MLNVSFFYSASSLPCAHAPLNFSNMNDWTKKTGLSLLARSVLRFLGSPLRILGHHRLCRSSPLLSNTCCLSLSSFADRQHVFRSQYYPYVLIVDRPCLQLHPRPMSGFVEAVKEEEPSVSRGTKELVCMAGQYSFSDGEGPTKNGRSATPMRDVSSADEYHRHNHVLEPIPLLPIQALMTPSGW